MQLAQASQPAPSKAHLEESIAKSTDADCARAADRALQGEPRTVARIFAGDVNSEAWQTPDAAMLHRIAVDPNIYSEVAKTWYAGSRVAIVAIATRSLELRADASYCFRASGTLARVTETSSGGNTIDDETRYLDESGHVVARRSHFSKIYPTPNETLSPDLRPSTPELFLTVRQLPFYSLIGPSAP